MTKRTCSVEVCGNPPVARGFCEMHWYRVKRYGDPHTVKYPMRKSPPPVRVHGCVAVVELTRELVALADAADLHLIEGHIWSASKRDRIHYANSNTAGYMHRHILGLRGADHVDHRNGDGLDNRRANLRVATPFENMYNTGPRTGQYKGVHYDKQTGRWRAQIGANGVRESLGRYDRENDAACAYNKAARVMHGDFARLNLLPTDHVCAACVGTTIPAG